MVLLCSLAYQQRHPHVGVQTGVLTHSCTSWQADMASKDSTAVAVARMLLSSVPNNLAPYMKAVYSLPTSVPPYGWATGAHSTTCWLGPSCTPWDARLAKTKSALVLLHEHRHEQHQPQPPPHPTPPTPPLPTTTRQGSWPFLPGGSRRLVRVKAHGSSQST
jgi:hypothetical protein